MKPNVLMMVTSDPRVSARPAEAVRIAAGVGTWRKAGMMLYLHGPAALALLDTYAETIIDARQSVLDAAYQAHPERFLGGPPTAARPPAAAWINKPTIQTKS